MKDYKLWQETIGNQSQFRYRGTATKIENSMVPQDTYNYTTEYAWSYTNVGGTYRTIFGSGGESSGAIESGLVTSVPDQQLDHTVGNWPYADSAYYVHHYFAKGVRHEWPSLLGSTVETLAARTQEKLIRGGKGVGGNESAYCLGSWTEGYGKPENIAWYYTPKREVPTSDVSIGGILQNFEGKVWLVASANSSQVITVKAGSEKHHPAGVANLTPTVSITVVSNAIHVGSTNWAAVKATNEYAYIEASISNGNTNDATKIVWSGKSEPVPGNPLQRRVSKSESKEMPVTARLGDSVSSLDVWIIWATVTVRHTNSKTPYSSTTDTGNDKQFPDYVPGNLLGSVVTNIGSSVGIVARKVEVKGKLTPSGVRRVAAGSWSFYQMLSDRRWLNDTNIVTARTNAVDSTFNTETLQDRTPDLHEEIFGLDAPVGLILAEFEAFKRNSNFRVIVRWNDQIASDPADWWVRQKVENQGTNTVVLENNSGNGTANLDQNY